MPIKIGVCGGSCSGKTTLTNQLTSILQTQNVSVIHLDSYYRDRSSVQIEERENLNYDHPDAFDFGLLADHLTQIERGDSVNAPIYDFKNHLRSDTTKEIFPKKILIVEGILVLAIPFLLEIFDIKIFVDTSSDIRLIRRLKREIYEFNNTFESAIHLYEKSARPMHNMYVEPTKHLADIVVNGDDDHLVNTKKITSMIEKFDKKDSL